MSDTYQAIYDAVRSRIGNIDIAGLIEAVLQAANLPHYVKTTSEAVQEVAYFYTTPSSIYRPALYIDGNKWCALYGEDLQKGVCGFGDSPELAMSDFDENWVTKISENKYDLPEGTKEIYDSLSGLGIRK